MTFISAKEAAVKWGISQRRVSTFWVSLVLVFLPDDSDSSLRRRQESDHFEVVSDRFSLGLKRIRANENKGEKFLKKVFGADQIVSTFFCFFLIPPCARKGNVIYYAVSRHRRSPAGAGKTVCAER